MIAVCVCLLSELAKQVDALRESMLMTSVVVLGQILRSRPSTIRRTCRCCLFFFTWKVFKTNASLQLKSSQKSVASNVTLCVRRKSSLRSCEIQWTTNLPERVRWNQLLLWAGLQDHRSHHPVCHQREFQNSEGSQSSSYAKQHCRSACSKRDRHATRLSLGDWM